MRLGDVSSWANELVDNMFEKDVSVLERKIDAMTMTRGYSEISILVRIERRMNGNEYIDE